METVRVKNRLRTGSEWRREREGDVQASTIQQGESMKTVGGKGDGTGGERMEDKVVIPMSVGGSNYELIWGLWEWD